MIRAESNQPDIIFLEISIVEENASASWVIESFKERHNS
jgi:hypothetical protein